MRDEPSNIWFLIIAKDKSCQGYMCGKTKEEACKNFGLKVELCFIKRVIWNGKEFVETDKIKQGKLL